MRDHIWRMFLIVSLVASFRVQVIDGAQSSCPECTCQHNSRRILHQPLFPVDSTPLLPPPPPMPDIPDEGQPFSNEVPAFDQGYQPPPFPDIGTSVASPAAKAPPPPNPIKKLVIITASTLVTVGMMLVLAFFLCKNRREHHNEESQELVGENLQRIDEESRVPPPAFLCLETTEPSTTTSLVNEANIASGSPYHNLNSGKRFNHCRPSPNLQPMPPLTKAPPPPRMSSPPPMSSSDDEGHDTSFDAPREMSPSHESPSSQHYNVSNKTSPVSQARPDNLASKPLPHSKRTPPKSRFSVSSPDTRPAIAPSIKQSLLPSPPQPTTSLGPLQPCKPLPLSPSRTKFSASPPSPVIQQYRSVANHEQKASKITIPHPPPPPPLPTAMTRNHAAAKTYNSSPIFKQTRRSSSKSPSPKASPLSEKTRHIKEVNKGVCSPEKFDAESKESRTKMKQLHWDKVRATTDRDTVWDHLKSTSFQLNEGAMESLFGCNSATPVPRQAPRKFVLPSFEQENRILDSKKSQNIAILLRALNVTRDEVSEALLDGNQEGLGPELFETLVKMAPSKEEEIKLREYNGEISKLGTAERFLKAILDIPFAFKRVEALLFKANFNMEVKYLRKSFQTLEEASEELKNSRLFLKLLEAVLRAGNHMNGGTNRGDAKAFKLDTLLKLVDIKGKDGKTTLLHFVVQEVIRSEGTGTNTRSESQLQKSNLKFNEEDFKKEGLQVVAGLSKELGNVKNAAGMDSDVLGSYVAKLEQGFQTVRQVQQYESNIAQDKFVDSMKVFLEEAADEISRVKAEERKALSLVKEVTQYFHGDDAKREAHPLRIFMIIRNFLSILDNVCKDVGRMQDKATMCSGRSFRISAAAPLPVLSRYNMQNDRSSDDDSM
ncbi:formin-like protein 6 [Salvia splendens]|uniref:formin-like protein 6 n=1 Tax=Salvia splendens TaxID=180675 RepID=UPI001C275344|nr:formin-like protein 6 [Salvia splendens]